MPDMGRNTPKRASGKATPTPRANDRESSAARAKDDDKLPRFLADAPRQPSCLEAWKHFACELAVALRGLEEDEWLVLSAKNRNRFVQFMNQGCGFRAETISDFYLADNDRLTEEDRASLLDLGWDAPTNLPDELGFRPDGSPNYSLDLANPVPLEDLAAMAVNTLVLVHGVQHPNLLEYATGGGVQSSIRLPNLGIRRTR